jgi:uncharacterized membrane protein SpoIIM required for sporulation
MDKLLMNRLKNKHRNWEGKACRIKRFGWVGRLWLLWALQVCSYVYYPAEYNKKIEFQK